MNCHLVFEASNVVTYTAFVRGNFMLHYAKDPWTAIVRHFLDANRRYSPYITPERVKSELFPKMPLFACRNVCLKLVDMGAAEPVSDNVFQLTNKGKDIADKGINLQPLGEDHVLAITWMNIDEQYVIVRAEIQTPDAKSRIFVPEGYKELAELLRTPILVKNGEAYVILTGKNPVFGSRFNGGPEEKNEKATLTLTPDQATIKVGKATATLNDFPSLSDVFEDVWYRGLKLVYDSKAGVYQAAVGPEFNDDFPFKISIRDLGLNWIEQLGQAGFRLSEQTRSVECVPKDEVHAQKAFTAAVGARVKKVKSDEITEKFPLIVQNLKNDFAAKGFENLVEPSVGEYQPPMYPNRSDIPTPGGGQWFMKTLLSLTGKKGNS